MVRGQLDNLTGGLGDKVSDALGLSGGGNQELSGTIGEVVGTIDKITSFFGGGKK